MRSRMRFFLYGFRLPFGFRGGISLNPMDFKRRTPKSARRQALPLSVYVIATGDGLCKIGVSRDPEARLSQLQIGCPYELHIAYVCTLQDQAHDVESFAHMLLGKRAVGGEWFQCSEREAIDAVDKSVSSFGKVIKTIKPEAKSPILDVLMILITIVWAIYLMVWVLRQLS